MSSKSPTTRLSVRVNLKAKENAEQVLKDLGLNFSELFNLLLHQVAMKNAVPFELAVSKPYVPSVKSLEKIENIERGAAQLAGPFETFEEYKSWLEEDDDEV